MFDVAVIRSMSDRSGCVPANLHCFAVEEECYAYRFKGVSWHPRSCWHSAVKSRHEQKLSSI